MLAACMFVGAALPPLTKSDRRLAAGMYVGAASLPPPIKSECGYVCDKQHTYILHTTNYKQHTAAADRNPTSLALA